MTGLLCAGLATAMAACGGDDDDGSATPDAGVDAGPQAMPTQGGSIGFFDTTYNGMPELGNGPLALVGPIADFADMVPPSFEDAPGSPFACKAYEFTPEQYLDPGVDVGAVTLSLDNSDWVVPTCVLLPDLGWLCPGPMGTGGDITVVDAGNGIISLSDSAVTFTSDDIGRLVAIMGSAGGANDGFFPVIDLMDSHTILFNNPSATDEAATAAMYMTLGGLGPAGKDDPIADDAVLHVDIAASDDPANKVQDLSTMTAIGGNFTLDDDSKALISNVPVDGSAFEIGCEGAGGDCGTSMATGLQIETTDGDIAGLPPFVFPNPAAHYNRIFCIFLVGQARVPADDSAFIKSAVDAGATRIRTSYVRAMPPTDVVQTDADVTILAGHATIGFTDP